MFIVLARWIYIIEAYVFHKKTSLWPSILILVASAIWVGYLTGSVIISAINHFTR